MSGAAHGNNRQLNAIKANEYTFIFRSGTARLMFTFTRSGDLVTTSEYQGALVKRVGTAHAASMDQARELLERIADRGMQIDVVVDQNCHPQRETIQRRPTEIAAIEISK